MRLLFFAHDPGGVNALAPLIERLDGLHECCVMGKDVSVGLFNSLGITCNNISSYTNPDSIQSLRNFFIEKAYDCIITGTSANDYSEKYIWVAAKGANTRCMAILDSWTNLGIRFSCKSVNKAEEYENDITYLPDEICVIDDYSREKLAALGVRRDMIHVTGQPHFQQMMRELCDVPKHVVQDYRRKVTAGKNIKLIMYASDAISKTYNDTESSTYWGFNEKTIFEELIMSLSGYEGEFAIVIRPHPMENTDYWERLINNRTFPFPVILDSSTPISIELNAADVVIGSYTMLLLEAMLIDKPIMSLQIGLNRQDIFYLSQSGIIKTITDRESLEKCIQSFFSGGLTPFSLPEVYKKDSVAIIEKYLEK